MNRKSIIGIFCLVAVLVFGAAFAICGPTKPIGSDVVRPDRTYIVVSAANARVFNPTSGEKSHCQVYPGGNIDIDEVVSSLDLTRIYGTYSAGNGHYENQCADQRVLVFDSYDEFREATQQIIEGRDGKSY